MLTTILKEDVPLVMDPDSPLNRAHQKDRQAERLLNAGRYEEAIAGYQRAAELAKEAMTTTVDASALFSLQLQYESYLKQPLIIKRRQEENLLKIESVPNSPLPWTNQPRANQSQDPYFDIPLSLKGDLPTPTNGYSDEQCYSLEDACNSLEETRPLLECLREHSVADGDRHKYFAGQFLESFNHKQSTGKEQQKTFVNGRKMPKNDQTIIEELQMQNKELCQHILRSLHNMDHCETENRQLKAKIARLEQELATLKIQTKSSSDTNLSVELGTPFSLSVSSVSVTTPPTEIPPLPPLELPDFDVN